MRYIDVYLDESGNLTSHYFVVAGFYIISDQPNKNISIERKIKSNVLKTEMAIKLIRKDKEPELLQFIDPSFIHDRNKDKEVKWHDLSNGNKAFLSGNLKFHGQHNVSIISDLRKWKNKVRNDRTINLDYIYNYMVKKLVHKIYRAERLSSEDKICVTINIDQRTDVPKDKEDFHHSSGLATYINTEFYMHEKITNVKIESYQFSSKQFPLIRYADYYAGIVASMLRKIKNTTDYEWDKNVEEVFEEIHRRIPCTCYSALDDSIVKSKTISELKKKCKKMQNKKVQGK